MCVKWLVRTIEHANYSQFMSDGHAEGISILYVIFMLGTGHIYYVPVGSDFCNGTRAEIPPPRSPSGRRTDSEMYVIEEFQRFGTHTRTHALARTRIRFAFGEDAAAAAAATAPEVIRMKTLCRTERKRE